LFRYGIFPTLFVIAWLLLAPAGKQFTAALGTKWLTQLHVVRIAVELVLYGLFINAYIPEVMTFTGANYDILAGLTALPVAYLTFEKATNNKRLLLIWNFISLCLLIVIVILATLSAPTPVQQLGLEQPNVAILYFPFSWLPTIVVPIVLYSHVAVIYQVITQKRSTL
jgi:hypothetical protein